LACFVLFLGGEWNGMGWGGGEGGEVWVGGDGRRGSFAVFVVVREDAFRRAMVVVVVVGSK